MGCEDGRIGGNVCIFVKIVDGLLLGCVVGNTEEFNDGFDVGTIDGLLVGVEVGIP